MLKLVAVLLVSFSLVSARDINTAGLNLIKSFEGFRANFYNDAVGVKTIGYGHACQPTSACNSIHAPLTVAQGEALLRKDLATYEACVQRNVPFVNNNQFAALVSFAYNMGCGALQSSTLLRDVKARNYRAAAGQFGLWVHAGGRVLAGLVRRRAAERALFCSSGGC